MSEGASMRRIEAANWIQGRWRQLWLCGALAVHLALTGYQLGLPGLHYDEAKEAGINAMELLTGADVSAFRNVVLTLGGLRLPIMVQDYIGALNVYLALPFLGLSGIGVPNLRALSIVISLCAMVMLERAVSAWWLFAPEMLNRKQPRRSQRWAPISAAGLVAVTLLAGAPSYVFWARQGIFVTNLTQPLCLLLIWQGVEWLRRGGGWPVVIGALAAGLALYAKLIALWVVCPYLGLLLVGWIGCQRQGDRTHSIGWGWVAGAEAAFLLAVAPLLFFNWQTGGTLTALLSNARSSYYGVDNLALGANMLVRGAQVWQVLRGEPFWYLGAVHVNALAPWLAAAVILVALWRRPALLTYPLLLLSGAFVLSLFTITDLFVTHYALLLPLFAGVAGLALVVLYDDTSIASSGVTVADWRPGHLLAAAVLVVWVSMDLITSIQYHRTLQSSGGLSNHSDASYQLAYHLRYNGYGAPIMLDWGIEAPVRYLTQGKVRPIELFGYDSPDAPAPEFAQQIRLFLERPDSVYVLHAPEQTVFHGRREAFFAQAEIVGVQPELEKTFRQRDGVPIFELWRLERS